MCIAIYKPQGFHLLDETIENCWNSNPDGAGFMYAENGVLHVKKGLMTLENFKTTYEPHKNKDCVLHFRIRTHGDLDKENTHPFLVDKNIGVVHNGIISKICTKTDPTKSDTWHFCQLHLSELAIDNHKFYQNPVYKELIESYIGQSKLIFMDNEGNVEIFNEKLGSWNTECWFSNSSWNWSPAQPTNTLRFKNKFTPQPRQASDFLKIGDVCKLNFITGYGKTQIPKGSYVKICSFGIGISVHIEEIISGIKALVTIENLTPLDEIHQTTFKSGDICQVTQNYNHFRIGNKVKCIISETPDNKILVKDPNDDIPSKTHWIPTRFLKYELSENTILQRDTSQDSLICENLTHDPYYLWD